MQLKLKSFLSLSGIITGILLLVAAYFWLEGLEYSAQAYFKSRGNNDASPKEFANQVINAIKWMGVLLLMGSLILIFIRKKFSNSTFAGIFAAVVIISLLVAAWVGSTIN